ncbi:type 1 periplasmic-binding domain-containing protein [Couchioplanes caeruleus]|nr:hypothetical protein [Couchioplanes caeruleus]
MAIEAGMPELTNRHDLIDRYARALATAGLILDPITAMMYQTTLSQPATTDLGNEFLAFSTDPETKAD